MKKIAFALLALLTYSATAQNMIIERPDSLTTVVRGVSHPKTEWLSPFTKVVVPAFVQTKVTAPIPCSSQPKLMFLISV